jgi:hypothetical protein
MKLVTVAYPLYWLADALTVKAMKLIVMADGFDPLTVTGPPVGLGENPDGGLTV